jgi:hypothetical protein
MAKTKTHGLADFGVKQSQPADDSFAPLSHDALTSSSHDAKKAKGDTVACTVRLPRAAWLKVQHLALDEGTSFQALAVAGLDAELKRRGLPGIEI